MTPLLKIAMRHGEAAIFKRKGRQAIEYFVMYVHNTFTWLTNYASSMVQNPTKNCVCRLCTCGTHNCPKWPVWPKNDTYLKLLPFNEGHKTGISEFMEEYIPKTIHPPPIDPPKLFRWFFKTKNLIPRHQQIHMRFSFSLGTSIAAMRLLTMA